MRLAMDSSRTPTLLFRQTRFTKILVEICRTFEDLDFRVVVSPRRPTRRKGGRERCLDNKVEEICLQHGIAEVWRTLCRARGAEAQASEESLSQRLHAASEALCGEGVTVGELCRARDMRGFDTLVTTFPYLGTAPPSD